MSNALLPWQTIQVAYRELCQRVTTALRTQIGDSARLKSHRDECLRLMIIIQNHTRIIPAQELRALDESLQAMIEALDDAAQASAESVTAPPVPAVHVIYTGRPGRPRIEIDPDILADTLEMRGSTELAEIFNCSSRTVRRRALDLGLAEPGHPVYVDHLTDDGTMHRYYTSSTRSMSDLSDDELDHITRQILDSFPDFGRRMIDGHLKFMGIRVPRSRLQASYLRVHGPPTSAFGIRRIVRRVYSVPGANALWHHDGQHGLIRWKIVFHAFIDGFSRFLLGVRAHNNNRAATVLQLFNEITEEVGVVPSRVRGDHGVENLLVAAQMEELQGIDRGSYIWGRSVHNIRIERLWVDLTLGFGGKWKQFFQELEVNDGLNTDINTHIWLLHHLFLPEINRDALLWRGAWNNHRISIARQRLRTPRDMYYFNTLLEGSRGLVLPDDDGLTEVDLAGYGVDWGELADARIRGHHDAENHEDHGADEDAYNPFLPQAPEHFSVVEVDEPDCPLTVEQVEYLDTQLQLRVPNSPRTTEVYRLRWITALQLSMQMFVLE